MKNDERRARGGWLALTAGVATFVLAVSVALAGGAPPPIDSSGGLPPHPARSPIPMPVVSAPASRVMPPPSAQPMGHLCAGLDMKNLAPGTRVPLSCLPRLPMRVAANTRTPAQTAMGRLRPQAASGATVDLTSGAGCGSSGALYSVGCSLTWQATNNTDWANSTYQDYVVAPNQTTATATGGTYANNASSPHVTVMSVQGTYAFFVYDTVAQVIVSIVYANTGTPFTIGVYQDPFHTQQAYQYDAGTSPTAYIFLPSVSTTDVYVIEVMSTAVNAYCVFLTPNGVPAPPAPTPRPTGAANSLLCNPTTSAGVSAPAGTLSLQWPITPSYQAGTYSVLVYDKTSGQTLGQVQVSLTGNSASASSAFQLYPTPGAAPTPAVFSTPPTTTFAWDSLNEQSVAGIVAAVPNQIGTAPTGGSYRMTVTDPDGQVVGIPATNAIPGTCTSVSNNAANCTVNGTFSFAAAAPALNKPGNYPNNTWTMQLYAPSNQEVEASQYFQIKGYSLSTQFNIGGVISQAMPFANAGGAQTVAANMIFTNTANVQYPFAPDPIKGIEYVASNGNFGSTACATNFLNVAFTPPAAGAGNCGGVTIVPAGCTGAQLHSAGGCAVAETDSTGGAWTLTDWCSTATPTNPGNNDLCVLKITPNNNNDLVGGASITTASFNFYAQGGSNGWPCFFTPCSTVTSILPLDGLSWSSQSNLSPAWTPVTYGSVAGSITGRAGAYYIGTMNSPGNTSRFAPATAPTTKPYPAWTNSHFYPSQFAQGTYQNTTPFQSASGQEDILVINLSNCNGTVNVPAPTCPTVGGTHLNMGETEITFPPGINASLITVDPSEPALPGGKFFSLATGAVGSATGCVNVPPTNAICLNPGANSPAANGNSGTDALTPGQQGQIWLDVPASQAAYIAQELQVQSYSTNQLFWQSLGADNVAASTPVVGGGIVGTAVDGLSIQGLSLNANLMGAQFNPSTVSPSGATTAYSLVYTNTLSGADPNPDPVDAVVIEQTTNKTWTASATSITGSTSTGWTAPSGVGFNPAGNTMEYWFTACNVTNWNVGGAAGPGPPQTPPGVTNPSSQQTALTPASCANSKNAIAPGGSLTFNFTLADNTPGSKTFYVFSHGANGGGWANLKTLTVNSTAETASAKFFSVAQGSTDAACSTTSNVAANTVATVAKSPNCFIYEVTNTGTGAQNIGTVDITLPAFDVNGLATGAGDWSLVGAPITQFVVLGRISAGSFVTTGLPAGCSINAANTIQPVPGSTNGKIEVHGCTAFTPGLNLAVEFVANTPSVQSNSYLLPASIDGATSGLAWVGSDEVTVAFSLGLSVTVDPSNPGPGGSHPTPNCNPAQCVFSGSVLDFGSIGVGSNVVGTDVVRATVIYEGATLSASCPAGAPVTANTWQVSVSVSSNPFNELFTDVDEANSTAGLSYTATAGALFNPTGGGQVLSCGPEQAGGVDYDTLMNFKTVPSETAGHVITVTYTLISN